MLRKVGGRWVSSRSVGDLGRLSDQLQKGVGPNYTSMWCVGATLTVLNVGS